MTIFLLLSCSAIQDLTQSNLRNGMNGIDPYFIIGSYENRQNLIELFRLLKLEEPGTEGEFVVIREIAANFARNQDFDRLIHFLSERTINNPGDPYNAYYLLMIAHAYMQLGSMPIAAFYFDLIVDNYPDLTVNGDSIHLISLKHLIELNTDPVRQVWYYNELISRFPDQIDLGTAFFHLAQASERIGDWNGALEAYANFIPFPGTIIHGFPNAHQHALQLVNFARSSKDWTYESVDELKSSIQHSLRINSPRALRRSMARVNFFARSWGQVARDDARMINVNFEEFMRNNRIRYSPTLDPSSTATEAFLRTTGWTRNMNTWFFYFRRINFPQDPNIHGRWEWAGIYYGERF